MVLSIKNDRRGWSGGGPGRLLVALAVVGLCGCTSQHRHAVLTFFFDVPESGTGLAGPASATPAGASRVPERRGFQPVVVTMYKHEPFELKECTKCHQSEHSQKLGKEEPRLCYDCHGKMLKKMTFVHKPAEEGTCKKCHVAHQSPQMFLLPKPELDLCKDCHKPVSDLAFVHTPVAEGHCSRCHNPHGGTNELYLPAEGDPLCAACHEDEKMRAVPAHKDLGDRACMGCHHPHQSDTKGLLRAVLP